MERNFKGRRTQSIHLTEQHNRHELLRKLSREGEAMSRLDLGNGRRRGLGSLFGRSFGTLSRRLLDRFALASGVGLKESPSLVI